MENKKTLDQVPAVNVAEFCNYVLNINNAFRSVCLSDNFPTEVREVIFKTIKHHVAEEVSEGSTTQKAAIQFRGDAFFRSLERGDIRKISKRLYGDSEALVRDENGKGEHDGAMVNSTAIAAAALANVAGNADGFEQKSFEDAILFVENMQSINKTIQ